jgi:hypothetical protein
VGAALDVLMFDANAGDDVRPAGLRYGVAASPAAAAGTAPTAMMADLGALAAAVAPVGGLNIAFVAAPGEAVKIMLAAGPKFAFPVFASSGLTEGTVMAVALNALASASDPAPKIKTSSDAILHLEDTTPLPGLTGTPVASMFQIDGVAIRLVLMATWGLRVPTGAVAFIEEVTW